MIKSLITFAVITLILVCVSCKNDSSTEILEYTLDSSVAQTASQDSPGKIPSDLSYWTIVLDPTNHDWRDLDAWYKEELPKHKGAAYYHNLQSVLFFHLIDQFKLDEKADYATVEYYIKEQLNFGYQYEPDVYVKCLKRLERDGVYKYLYPYAVNKYNSDIALLEGKPALTGVKEKYIVLKEYADHLRLKYNIKVD